MRFLAALSIFLITKGCHGFAATSAPVANTLPLVRPDTSYPGALLLQTENYLTASSLAYLYAELRQLSYCGYTTTEFEEIDCNREGNPITAFKLLDVLLRARATVLKNPDVSSEGGEDENEDWKSDLKMLECLKDIANKEGFVPPTPGTKRARDLESLQKQIYKLKAGAALEQRAGQPFWKKKRAVDDNVVQTVAKSSVKAILNVKPSVDDYPDTTDAKMLDLVKGFCEQFIEEKSLLRNIFKGDIELMYFGDRFPQKECVYGVIIDKTSKRVGVTFRGSVNLNDWAKNVQVEQTYVDNPAKKDGDSKQPEKFGLHYGFHAFLLRERLDKKRADGRPGTKFDRIVSRVEPYVKQGWKLSVSGHSLGGALATIFGFYAAADKRIQAEENPVEVFTFASPFVGDERFREAFKGLEREGKLFHARIVNNNDYVTMNPFVSPHIELDNVFDFSKWNFSWYKHVGLQMLLYKDKAVDVSYPKNDGFLAEFFRTMKSNIFFSLPHIFQALDNHDLAEYESRLLASIDAETKTGDDKYDVELQQYYEREGITHKED